MGEFVWRSRLPVSAAEAYAWHARPGAFERLTPPWEAVRVRERRGGIEPGARVALTSRIAGLPAPWVIRHGEAVEGRLFTDVQVAGPFARWVHRHRFEPLGDECELIDEISWRLPGGRLAAVLGEAVVERRLRRLFAWRHAVTRADLLAHRGGQPMRILISGASGLIGRALAPFLTTGGHEVVRLSRTPGAGTIVWDPAAGRLEPAAVAGFDAVIHLAGEPLATGRWNAARKERIAASRRDGTRLLAEALAASPAPPRTLVSASAIGYYGDRGEELLTEASAPGEGFLAEVCRAWEEAAEPARSAGVRVVHPRLGVVLTTGGGALARLLPPFRLGLGGPLGSGRQWVSWISLPDTVAALARLAADETLSGPVNLVAPEPVRQVELARTVGRLLRRPAVLPAPAVALRAALGEVAEALLLASQRVSPAALLACGHTFRHAALTACLSDALGLE